MTRLIRPAVLLALFAALAAVLAACGGGSSDDPNKLLKETFSGSHKVTSGKLNVAVDVSAQGVQNLSQPVKIALTGPFQSQGSGNLPKFDLNLTFSGGGQSFSAGAVSTGDAGFLQFQGQAYEVPAQLFNQFKTGFTQAQQQNASKKGDNVLSKLGLNPIDWLKDPTVKGDEEVGGTNTKHISAQIDVPKFADDLNALLKNAGSLGAQTGRLPSQITTQQRQQIIDAVKSASLDVWTGADDKTLRKVQLKLNISGSGGRSGDLTFTLEIDDLNQAQTINAPANAKPLSELQTQLQSLGLGGALGGAGGATPGAGSGTTPGATGTPSTPAAPSTGGSGSSGSAAKLQQYTQCLQAAAGDAAKAQKCASLLR